MDGTDLWIATREPTDMSFSNHTRLSDKINTANVDSFPFLTDDDTLYFTRNAIPGVSGWDLYQTGPELLFDPLDFNRDATTGIGDIDRLCGALFRDQFGEDLDLTKDGILDADDLAEFLDAIDSLPGDTDLDGDVDFTDFQSLAERFGRTGGSWSRADFDCSGDTDFHDFVVLADNFGVGVEAGETASQSVPEPNAEFMAWCLWLLLFQLRPNAEKIGRKTARTVA